MATRHCTFATIISNRFTETRKNKNESRSKKKQIRKIETDDSIPIFYRDVETYNETASILETLRIIISCIIRFMRVLHDLVGFNRKC